MTNPTAFSIFLGLELALTVLVLEWVGAVPMHTLHLW
jgi:hypothetical protein